MTQQHIENTDPTATFPDIKNFRTAPNPPGRRELLARIEGLELRVNGQEARLSSLVLREAAARRARTREAQASEEVSVRIVKTISFHLNFTVEEMAKHFEVNSKAIHANQYEYAQELANEAITSLLYDEPDCWPVGPTKVEVLSTDVVDIG